MRQSWVQAILGKSRGFFKRMLPAVDDWRRDFLPKLLRGVAAAQDLVVTEIVREAFQNPEEFRSGYKSFSRNLNSAVWDDQEEEIRGRVERRTGQEVGDRTPIAVDTSDVAKPRAEEMEHLGWVRDGDRGEIVRGFWTFESYVAGDPEAPKPLVNFPFSLGDPQFPSFRHALREGYRRMREATGGRGVLVEDRGFDGEGNFEDLQEFGLKWLIRLVGSRGLKDAQGNALGIVSDFVATWRLEHVMRAPGRCVDGETLGVLVAYDSLEVQIPGVPGRFWLIAVRRCSEPADGGMYLLTNVPILRTQDAEWAVRLYHDRWRAEDCIKLAKDMLGMEGVRTLNFRPLRRLMMACYWVLTMLSELRLRLTPHELKTLLRRCPFFPRKRRLLHHRLLWAVQWALKKSGVT